MDPQIGADQAQCYYAGGGDSGAIENIITHGKDFKKKFEEGDIEYDWDSTKDLDIDVKNESDFNEYLETLFYKKLGNIEDWWNNDGGYGTLMMDVETGEFKNINNTYYTQTETFNHSGKFSD